MSMIHSWYEDSQWFPPPGLDDDDRSAFAAQQRAGTTRLMDGFLVYQWAEAQQKYYDWINRRTTGQRWLSRFIQQLWETAWDFWRHRQKILHTPDEAFLHHLHRTVNHTITQVYSQFTPQTPPYLSRWFSQPLQSLLDETLDFKQQWLSMIQTITQHPPEGTRE
jgi:hypothetical protein